MNFEEAEAKFRQLQARVQRGESISRAEYEEQVSQLAVQDSNGALWEINPRTGKWMYFDGAEWISGTPPGHDTSIVVPMPGAPAVTPSAPLSAPLGSTSYPSTPPPPLPPRAAASYGSAAAPEPVPTYQRVGQEKKSAPPKPPMNNPPMGGEQKPVRPQRQGAFGRREWIPLAIGAVVLLVCAVLLFVGGNFMMNQLSPAKTPTRAALPVVPNSPVPTIVRLPSPTPIPPTPVPVIAKITETQANVRNKPTTSGTTIVVKLKKDTLITLIAAGSVDGANQWYQINIPDNPAPGWIRSDTFQIVSGDPKTLPPGGGAPTATPTKAAVAPGLAQPTATLTPIGVIPPTPKP